MNPLSFFRKSAPSAPFAGDDAARMKLYRKLRFQSFIAGTVGYSLYYVCRTSLNVVKKPILESGALDATQLGIIGSALLFAYAIGKFVNGFLSDHSNIKRFMADCASRPSPTCWSGCWDSRAARAWRAT